MAAGRWLGAKEQLWQGQCVLREQPGLPSPDRDRWRPQGAPQPFSCDEALAPTSAPLACLRPEVSERLLLAGFHCSLQGEVMSAVVTGEGGDVLSLVEGEPSEGHVRGWARACGQRGLQVWGAGSPLARAPALPVGVSGSTGNRSPVCLLLLFHTLGGFFP